MSSLTRRLSSICVRTLLYLVLSLLNGHHPHPSGARDGKPTIRIAVILPSLTPTSVDWMFAKERVWPALTIALENMNSVEMGMGFHLTVVYRDGRCDLAESLNQAILYYINDEVDVFFGPCCDWPAAPIARQTRFWNIPMVTAGTMAGEFGFEKLKWYPLLTRVGPNINSMSSFVVDLMLEHNWKKVKLFYDSEAQGEVVDKLCHLVANGIYQTLSNHNNIDVENYIKHDNFKLLKPVSHEELKEEVGFNYAD